jgi:hypothetical protein
MAAATAVTLACGGGITKEGVRSGSTFDTGGTSGTGGAGGAMVGDGGRAAMMSISSDAGSLASGGATAADAAAIERHYALTESRTLLPPRDGGAGITADGSLLWLLFSLDGEPAELVLLDPETNSAVRRLQCPGVTSGAGIGVYGLGYGAGSFWVAFAGNRNELIRVGDQDCSIQQRFGSPSVLGPVDLELNASGLLVTTGTGGAYLIDPPTGLVEISYPVADRSDRDAGSAMRDGELWVASMFSSDTWLFLPGTGTPIGSASGRRNPGDGSSPMCFFEGQLVTLTGEGITFYDIAQRE